MALTKVQKQETTTDIKNHDTDTGSTEVQIALQTKRIAELSDHLKTHPKDIHSRRGLLQIVANRRKMIKYLQTQGRDRYNTLAAKLGLKSA